MDKLHMDSAPFIRHPDTTKGLMSDVILMLAALTVWSVYRNGLRSAVLLGLTAFFAAGFDYLCTKILKTRGTVRDLSAVVTGMIVAAGFPTAAPLWLCPLGAFLAIVGAKAAGGGLGKNRLNPAAAALLILHLLFPITMNRIPDPSLHLDPFTLQFRDLTGIETALDAVVQDRLPSLSVLEMLLGTDAGTLLYTPALLILLSALFLLVRHTADFRPILSCLGVSALMSFFSMPGEFSLEYMAAYLMSGGLLFAAVFMLTDPVTIPATNPGRWLFGTLFSLLYYVLNHLISPMPALYAAICLMNLAAPALEYLTLPTPFGRGSKSVAPVGKRHRDYMLDFSRLIRHRTKQMDQALGKRNDVSEKAPSLCARVLCGGTAKHCQSRYFYDGAHDCASVTLVGGGSKACFNACEGYGDCVRACKKGAIRIVDGIAAVDSALCDGCGECLEACPKRIIALLPAKARYWVGCLSPDDPVSTRKHCSAGCIGCRRCEKVCPTGAITVDGHVARIHHELCSSCGNCFRECPRKCIWELL